MGLVCYVQSFIHIYLDKGIRLIISVLLNIQFNLFSHMG
jgi:hypothetical protein